MGETGEDADGRPVNMEKKSKKKNKINDLLDVGDGDGGGNNHVEIDGGVLKEKGHKHRKKERKSESNEDGNEDRHDKANLVIDGDLQKKDNKKKRKKTESNEDGDEDRHDKGNMVDDGDLQKKEKKKRKTESYKDGNEDQHDKGNLVNDGDLQKKDKKKKKKKKKKKSESNEDGVEDQQDMGNMVNDTDLQKKDKKKKKKKKRKSESKEDGDEERHDKGNLVNDGDLQKKEKKKKEDSSDNAQIKEKNNMEKPKAKGKTKKVSFSGHVEVFPSSDTDSIKHKPESDGLVRGKRFTPEEDAIVKEAVLNYITARGLGDEGLKMVLNCNSHPGMKKCWQEIGTCIPYRPYTAVYYRAHILFERGENRSWTPEEIEFLKEYHEKHGNNWKKLAEELGKHRFHVKDTWRRIKLKDLKAGKWSQEEYQSLYDLVNLDLQMKINGQEKKSKHGMLRDNIPWTAISEKLTTRSDATCCTKWYNQLTSSLVAEKKWCDADDYRMIGALYELDAACVEDVDWDNLLEHRPGDICRKRWNQMVLHIGHHGSKPFTEQVDILAKRYCPDLAETREEWDNKPIVP